MTPEPTGVFVTLANDTNSVASIWAIYPTEASALQACPDGHRVMFMKWGSTIWFPSSHETYQTAAAQ